MPALSLVLSISDNIQHHFMAISTESGNQSCPEASIPDLAVRIIRLFEELSLGSSEPNLTLVFPFYSPLSTVPYHLRSLVALVEASLHLALPWIFAGAISICCENDGN